MDMVDQLFHVRQKQFPGNAFREKWIFWFPQLSRTTKPSLQAGIADFSHQITGQLRGYLEKFLKGVPLFLICQRYYNIYKPERLNMALRSNGSRTGLVRMGIGYWLPEWADICCRTFLCFVTSR